jgi:two-component system LytT family response regulator
MKKLSAIIVDDEQDSREILRSYLNKYCPNVTLSAECADIIEARSAILKHAPQLVFLDIEMPRGNAFDLLEQWGKINFEVIFITAYSQYAVKAFSLSAAHYLLKPINIEELEKAVENVIELYAKNDKINRAEILLANFTNNKSQDQKLVLPLMEGMQIIKMNTILYCEAADNFTTFYLTDGQKMMICRNLKFYENALLEYGFLRIHRSTVINLEYLQKYIKGKGGSVIMEGGKELIVSAGCKPDLMNKLKG